MDDQFCSQLALRVERSDFVRKLSGWKKSFRLPDRCSSESTAFIVRCAKDEIKSDLDHYFAALKEAFGFTRRELTTDESEDGVGVILTPLFAYSIHVQWSPDQSDEVKWTRIIDGLSSQSTLRMPPFAKVFDQVFNTVQLTFPKEIQLENFIDAVEASESKELSLKYDRELTYCEILLPGSQSRILLQPSSMSIVHPRPCSAFELQASLESMQRLIQTHSVPAVVVRPHGS